MPPLKLKPFDIIVAYSMPTGYMGICSKFGIPWRSTTGGFLTSICKKRFDDLTLKDNKLADDRKNAVIIGRTTWELAGRVAFPDRITIVVSSSMQPYSNVGGTLVCVKSLDAALLLCETRTDIRHVYVAGGCILTKRAIEHCNLRHIYAIEVYNEHDQESDTCDLHRMLYKTFPLDEVYALPRKFEASKIEDLGGIFEKRFTKISRCVG